MAKETESGATVQSMRRIGAVLSALSIALVSGAQVASSTAEECGPATARASLAAYMVAANNGRFADLDAVFAPAGEFVWYSTAPPKGRVGTASRNRATLLAFFRARHLKREKLAIATFRHVGTQQRDGVLLANFNGDLRRTATDLHPERRHYKGTLRCADGSNQLIVVSIGGPL